MAGRYSIQQCINNTIVKDPNGKITILAESPPQNIQNEGSYTELWDTTNGKLRTVKGAEIDTNDSSESVYLKKLNSLDETSYVDVTSNDFIRIHQQATGTNNEIVLEKTNANVSKINMISIDNATSDAAYFMSKNDTSTGELTVQMGTQKTLIDHQFSIINGSFYMGPITTTPSAAADQLIGVDSATYEMSALNIPTSGLTNIYDSDGIIGGNRVVSGASTYDLTFNNLVNATLSASDSISINTSAVSGAMNLISSGDASVINVACTGTSGTVNVYGNSLTNIGTASGSTYIYGSLLNLPNITNATSGNILYYNAGSITYGALPSSVNIYNSNGSLSSNRVLNGSSYSLSLTGLNGFTVTSSNAISISTTGASHNITISTSGANSSTNLYSTGASSTCNVYANVTNLGRTGAYTTNIYGQTVKLNDIPSTAYSDILYFDSVNKYVTYGPVSALSNNIYTTDGTLTADRVLSGATTYSLTFNNLTTLSTTSSGNTSISSSAGNVILSGNACNISAVTNNISLTADQSDVRLQATLGNIDISALAVGSTANLSADSTSIGSSSGTTTLNGDAYAHDLVAGTSSDVVYFNTASKRLTHGAPTGGFPTIEGFTVILNSTNTYSDALSHVLTGWYSTLPNFISNPSLFNTATGVFTCLTTGYYAVKMMFTYDVSTTANVSVGLYDNTAGTFIQTLCLQRNTTSLTYRELVTVTGIIPISSSASLSMGFVPDSSITTNFYGRLASTPNFSCGCLFSIVRVS